MTRNLNNIHLKNKFVGEGRMNIKVASPKVPSAIEFMDSPLVRRYRPVTYLK